MHGEHLHQTHRRLGETSGKICNLNRKYVWRENHDQGENIIRA